VTAFRSPSNANEDCVESCTACERLCSEAIVHLQQRDGPAADPEQLAALSLCADSCKLAVGAIRSGAKLQVAVARACAAACELGARVCAAFGGDALLRACANACSNAARSCSELAHAGTEGGFAKYRRPEA